MELNKNILEIIGLVYFQLSYTIVIFYTINNNHACSFTVKSHSSQIIMYYLLDYTLHCKSSYKYVGVKVGLQ